MSNPPNILDQFRSHSIHYILSVSNNTESIRKILNPGNSTEAGFLANIQGKALGDDIGDGVYLLVDSRKTSEFSIKSVNFKSNLIPTVGNYASALISEVIEIQLEDPSGVGWFNYLRYLMDFKLKTDIKGMQFCLHFIFIGHTENGSSQIVKTVGIPMINYASITMADYTTRGALYNMGFVNISTGMADSLPDFSKLQNGINIEIKNSLLGNAIQAFENQINVKNRNFYLKSNPIQLNNTKSNEDGQVVDKNANKKRNGKLVQYMITIPPEWFYFEIATTANKLPETEFNKNGTAKEPAQKTANNTSQKLSTSQFSAMGDETIQNALDKLLKLSPQVSELFNIDKSKKGTGKIYNIVSSFTSDDDIAIIHYDIIEFSMPNVNNTTKEVETDLVFNREQLPNNSVPADGIEFNYLFSGKNEDVLDFSIKDLPIFNGLISQSQTGNRAKRDIESKDQKAKVDQPTDIPEKTFIGTTAENQLIVAPPLTKTEKENYAGFANRKDMLGLDNLMANSQYFHKALADIHAVISETNLTIRGNPELFASVTTETVLPHPKLSLSVEEYLINTSPEKIQAATAWKYDINSKSEPKGDGSIVSAHIEYRKHFNKLITELKPAKSKTKHIKVNVYGPKDYPFSNELDLKSYKVQLFYDFWYMASTVSSQFNGHNFTQTIRLHPMAFYGTAATEADIANNDTKTQHAVTDSTKPQ